ncbi:transglutaminaseTgpA domain-containing protein [Luteimicrobium sp. DT211]|uniref:transglutaminaseTgpA domain-containing protein n=1 Tax=Luteimicrobium sp. DT211 TaxID=3393412 RepID=UPI003CE9DE6B
MSRTTSTAPAEAQAPQRAARGDRFPHDEPQYAVPRARTRAGMLDLAALAVMLGVVIVGFEPVWGSHGYLAPAVGGAALGLLVAWLGAAFRWSTLSVAAATIVVYFVAGGALALGGSTVAGVVPTAETARGLLRGAVFSWKSFVTTAPPLSSFPDLALVPFVLLLLAGVLAGTIAWRAKRPVWALVPVLAALVGSILLGTIVAAHPVVQGTVLGVVALMWSAWRTTEGRLRDRETSTEASEEALRRLTVHRARTGAVVLAVAAVAAVALGPVVAPDHGRVVLREDVVPPPDLHEYVTPLAAFRHYVKDEKDDALLTVSGLPAGARVRLATLDAYDGVVYSATSDDKSSGSFVRVGAKVASDATGAPVTLDVQVKGYAGPWVPDVGALTGISYGGDRAKELEDGTYYDAVTGTALTTAQLRAGDSYTVQAVESPQPKEADLKGVPIQHVELPQPTNVPPSVQAKAEQFVGGATDPLTQLQRLRDALLKSGTYSSGIGDQPASRPGHSADRIDTLLGAETMVGDDEQFAVAYSLMAQSLGIPARVVMGVYPDAEDGWKAGTDFTAVGSDVHAWVEVPFQGKGWVAFDSVPEENNKVQTQPRSQQVPKPPVLQDPEPPSEPDQADTAKAKDDKKKEKDQDGTPFDWGHAVAVGAAVAIPLVLILLPFALVLGYKSRRRLRRRRAGDPADRISGGWHEVLDAAVDLGHPVPAGATRREVGTALDAAYPSAGTLTLAHDADATVFGTGEPTDVDVEAYWGGIEAAVAQMRASVPWRKRMAARFSLRSVRRVGRSGASRNSMTKAVADDPLTPQPDHRPRRRWSRPSGDAR